LNSTNPSSSIELLVLGALRYLGRGRTFDDIEELTGISQEVHRVFFHHFIHFGKTKLYDKFVKLPNNNNRDAAVHQHEFSLAGLNGAIGSTDAVHIVLEKVRYKNRNLHLGYKLSHTARTYNVTVNHRRRILSTTSGHPARWNDKTLVLFDGFVRGVHEGTLLDNLDFELLERNREGDIVTVKYKGCWFLVDNGYLNWTARNGGYPLPSCLSFF
jgi:hypothetical protein